MPFSEKTLDFLFENRLQDSKDWFDAHKPIYQQYVLEPLQELVVGLSEAALDLDYLPHSQRYPLHQRQAYLPRAYVDRF